MTSDARILLVIIWILLGLDVVRLGIVLFRRRLLLRRYIRRKIVARRMAVVPLTTEQLRRELDEQTITRAEIVRTGIKISMGVAVVVTGLTSLFSPEIPLIWRQWITTICILWLGLALEFLVRNDMMEDEKLHHQQEVL